MANATEDCDYQGWTPRIDSLVCYEEKQIFKMAICMKGISVTFKEKFRPTVFDIQV